MPKVDDNHESGDITGPEPEPSAPIIVNAQQPTPPRPKTWGFWVTFGFALLVGVVNSLASILAVLLVLDVAILSDPNFDFTEYAFSAFDPHFGAVFVVSALLSGAVSIGLVVGLVKMKSGISVAEYLGLKPLPRPTILKIAAITVGLAMVSMIVDSFRDLPEYSASALAFEGMWLVLAWVAIVGMAPLFEEVLFRGFMLPGFSRTRLGPALAIILTSAWWAMLHAQYGAFDKTVIFVLGAIFALSRLKTGSLWAPLTMHATWNFIAMIQLSLAQ
jgi:hypothetical protein